MVDAILIFKGVHLPDGRSLYTRNLLEFMPRRLEDVLSREANPFKY